MPLALSRIPSLLAILLVALSLGAAGCGSSSSGNGSASSGATTSSHVAFAKTKFILHAGLAFGAFHHFIYAPIKAGDLKHPFLHKLALVKAGLAALFVYHELKLALHDAQSSKLLSKLVSPITALQNKFQGLGSKLSSGSVNPADISQANSQISSVSQGASAAGQPITEQVPSHF